MRQIYEPNLDAPKVVNLGGGIENSLSLKELSNWCEKRFGTNEIFHHMSNDRWMHHGL